MYNRLEKSFEALTRVAVSIFGSSIAFILAIGIIVYWFVDRDWANYSRVDTVRDVILSITFLSFFILQKSSSHFSRSLQLKLDELVASHDKAGNHIIQAEQKTEDELKKLSEEHNIIKEDKKE